MHVHVHGAGGTTRVLKISLAVTLGYIVLLLVAGIRAHSLALALRGWTQSVRLPGTAAFAGRGLFPISSG